MAETPRNVPPEVIEALKRGDKAGAMKMLLQGKQITSLKDAMAMLQSLQASGALKEMMKVATPSRTLPPQVADALRSGNKIEAIRLLREATGIGLAEAKAAVDAHEAGHGMHSPSADHPSSTKPAPHAHPKPVSSVPGLDGLSPGEVPRTNAKAIGFVVVLVIAAVLIWVALK